MSHSSRKPTGAKIKPVWLSKAILCLLFITVCFTWGTTWLGIKVAVETIPPLSSAGLRFLIAFPLFMIFARIMREPILLPRRALGFCLMITVFYFSVPYYLINYGEQYVSSGLTSLLFSSMPVFILIFSALILKERIWISQILGIAIGFYSLYMILLAEGVRMDQQSWMGVAAIIAAAVMHALCYILTRKYGANISVITFNTLPIGIAGLALFLCGLALEDPNFAEASIRSWVALIYLGLVASVGGFIVYFYLLKRMSPILLSFVFILFPVVAIAIGAWYEGNPVSSEFAFFSSVMLLGFAITKIPVEKLLLGRSALSSKKG
ncbi:DMT family transporter [Halomonas sp. G11]|uniref:DMT family transporter n=1 Tax=Halomonas sp. G11 TaxID=1684425 RepID=UPI0007FC86E1|nr:DMT family transporter [Halomonas sp. G11]OAZ96722.1 multidrug transporter [Halomonas sp. G11]